MKTRILFICHGNVCRSPMGQYYMRHIVKEAGLEKEFVIDSAATSTEEIGNPVYPPARQKLKEYGINCDGHHARQLRRSDYDAYDYLVVMDTANYRNTLRMCGGKDPENKIHMLLEYCKRPGESVADPWYTRDFQATYDDVKAGCDALLDKLT